MSSLIPQRTDEVVLYQDDDQREIDRLRAAVEKAAEAATERLNSLRESRANARARASTARFGDEAVPEDPLPLIGDDADLAAAANAYDEFVKDAAGRGVRVAVRTIGRKWRSLAEENPPREKNAADAEWGFNVASFGEAVVPLCVVSIAGQTLSKEEARAEVDELSDGDFQRLLAAAVRLNTGRGPDPKASISEMLPRTTHATSESPDPSA